MGVGARFVSAVVVVVLVVVVVVVVVVQAVVVVAVLVVEVVVGWMVVVVVVVVVVLVVVVEVVPVHRDVVFVVSDVTCPWECGVGVGVAWVVGLVVVSSSLSSRGASGSGRGR